MSAPGEIDIALECIKMMYCLTDFGVPAIVARELGIMYRNELKTSGQKYKFNHFLSKTSYSWILSKPEFDYDKYDYAQPIRRH